MDSRSTLSTVCAVRLSVRSASGCRRPRPSGLLSVHRPSPPCLPTFSLQIRSFSIIYLQLYLRLIGECAIRGTGSRHGERRAARCSWSHDHRGKCMHGVLLGAVPTVRAGSIRVTSVVLYVCFDWIVAKDKVFEREWRRQWVFIYYDGQCSVISPHCLPITGGLGAMMYGGRWGPVIEEDEGAACASLSLFVSATAGSVIRG